MTLWFVGTGLYGAGSMSGEATKAISASDAVFVEQFTSPTGTAYVEAIEKMAPGRVRAVKRWEVEDGKKILNAARDGTASLVSWGDSYAATTHTELRVRAISDGIKTRTVHGASALTAIVGECGLHQYKVGRTATIMREQDQATTPYYAIYRNMLQGSHTMLLLEYDQDGGYFLSPEEAVRILQRAEEGQRRMVIRDDTFCIVASRIGSPSQGIKAGRISSLAGMQFGPEPHALIITGSLHFTEAEAVSALAECADEPTDNSEAMRSIPRQMLEKYVPMIETAVGDARKLCDGDARLEEVLDGAARYAQDAQRFLDEGQEDLAVLCVGYADGLADAVRIARGLEPAGASDAAL